MLGAMLNECITNKHSATVGTTRSRLRRTHLEYMTIIYIVSVDVRLSGVLKQVEIFRLLCMMDFYYIVTSLTALLFIVQ